MPNVRNSLAADTSPRSRRDGSRPNSSRRSRLVDIRAFARGRSSLDLREGRDGLRRDDGFVARAPRRLAAHVPHVGTPALVREGDFVGRHGEVPARPRGRPPNRVGLHSRHAQPDLLHLDAGRVRHEMRLLPDRQDGAGAKPDRRRDRRAGARARGTSSGSGTRGSTSCSWEWASRSTTTTTR